MMKKNNCDLCGKSIFNKDKTIMINKDNKNTIYICEECYNTFFNKSDKKQLAICKFYVIRVQ
ncbi:mszf55-1 [Clostridium botulinum]|nr:mszf55-1 [Clostridium botulinum]MBY7009076.1 mszf55-1 [Clostridium botulinum]NFH01806.1 mszf55-1 [Clostridium botulinum]NFH71563.1 mszf55-1 [Clostridium botulinum]NFI02728.1 mszf55-1 [Clostridium botulinum]